MEHGKKGQAAKSQTAKTQAELTIHDGRGSPLDLASMKWHRYQVFLNRLPSDREWADPRICAAMDIPPLYYQTAPVAWKPGFLWGPPESGKTFLAIQRLKGTAVPTTRPWHSGYEVDAAFVSIPALVTRLRAFYAEREAGSLDRIRYKAMNKPFVVLDDIGVSKATDFVRDELYGIIDHRLSNQLATLVTSNYSIDQLKTLLDERLASRLQSFGPIQLLSDKKYRTGAAIYE